jgi:hypothetical protein
VRTSAAVSLRTSSVAALLLAAGVSRAELLPCRHASDARAVEAALARLRSASDPCGESAEVRAALDALTGCGSARYEICVSASADRNLFDRPSSRDGIRTIVWNPELASELEPRCEAGRAALRREPTASLLHEIVHAAHDCAGLDPGELELEAVRVENIYRRAAGLRQRRAYGSEPLPDAMLRSCEPGACSCVPAATGAAEIIRPASEVRPGPVADGDTAP